jgi:hypothetical protein
MYRMLDREIALRGLDNVSHPITFSSERSCDGALRKVLIAKLNNCFVDTGLIHELINDANRLWNYSTSC